MGIEKVLFSGKVGEIPIGEIEVINPRERDKDRFEEVVMSIKRLGMLKPILVNEYYHEEKGNYELLCGEGRLIACKRLGFEMILAEVVSCSRKTGYIISLVENMARKKYTTIELAQLIYDLHREGATVEELSKITNRSKSFITQYVRLMKNGEERLIKAVEENRLPISIAARIATSPDADVQELLTEAVQQKMMSGNDVNDVKKLIEARFAGDKRITSKKRKGTSNPEIPESLNQLKKGFKNRIKKQEEYIKKCKGLENTVSLLQGFLETLNKDEFFRQLILREGIGIP